MEGILLAELNQALLIIHQGIIVILMTVILTIAILIIVILTLKVIIAGGIMLIHAKVENNAGVQIMTVQGMKQ
jgi:hypothetical protein